MSIIYRLVYHIEQNGINAPSTKQRQINISKYILCLKTDCSLEEEKQKNTENFLNKRIASFVFAINSI